MKVGPDMPADEFSALLDRQPPLEARWVAAPARESCSTVEWGDLADFEKRKLCEAWKMRAERADRKLQQVEALVTHGSEFQRRHLLRGSSVEQARWVARIRGILGLFETR